MFNDLKGTDVHLQPLKLLQRLSYNEKLIFNELMRHTSKLKKEKRGAIRCISHTNFNIGL